MNLLHPSLDRIIEFGGERRRGEHNRRLASHLAECPACREKLAGARTLRTELIEATAVELPAGAWERIAARVEKGEQVILPDDRPKSIAARNPNSKLRTAAAMLAVFLSGAAAASVWVGPDAIQQLLRGEGPADERVSVPVLPTVSVRERAVVAGVAVAPLDRRMSVTVEGASTGMVVRMRLIDGDLVEVTAVGISPDATFQTRSGTLGIVSAGSGQILVGIPRELDRLMLTINGDSHVVLDDGRIRIEAASADSIGGEYLLTVR